MNQSTRVYLRLVDSILIAKITTGILLVLVKKITSVPRQTVDRNVQ